MPYNSTFALYTSELAMGNLRGLIYNVLMLPLSGPITTRSLIVEQAWSSVFELYFYSLFAMLLFFQKAQTLYIAIHYGYVCGGLWLSVAWFSCNRSIRFPIQLYGV